MIASEVYVLEPLEGAEADDCVDMVAIDPELLQHYAFFEPRRLRDPIVSEIQLANVSNLVEALDGVEVVVG